MCPSKERLPCVPPVARGYGFPPPGARCRERLMRAPRCHPARFRPSFQPHPHPAGPRGVALSLGSLLRGPSPASLPNPPTRRRVAIRILRASVRHTDVDETDARSAPTREGIGTSLRHGISSEFLILFLLRPSARRHRKLQCRVHFLESISKTREANRLAKLTLLLPGKKGYHVKMNVGTPFLSS
jgi:hypothetical protein